ncbi:hypothetical protein VTO42DRAFT_8518 [Malbranchea cinnamomea]
MSLKQEIETWVTALAHYDNNEFEEALKVFELIGETAKIQFNCGVILATLGEHRRAVEHYQRAIAMDKYFAIAYFQQGVSNFLLGDFEEALVNFNDTLLYLRGNTSIDYEQLGLKFQLYSCEVLFNRGLSYIYLNQIETGMKDLEYASKEKTKPEHDVIDEAIRERAEGYTVFSIPVGVVYRPSPAKVKNLKTKEYLGKARLVAAANPTNVSTGFEGTEMKRSNNAPVARDDRPPESISYAATNLVQPNLIGRSRQQSEPPISRNVFPPTPPPENEKLSSHGSNGSAGNPPARSASVRAPKGRVIETEVLNGRVNGGDTVPVDIKLDVPSLGKPRPGTIRTASEPRGSSTRQIGPARYRDNLSRQPLFRETTDLRRNNFDPAFAPVTEVDDAEQAYDTYHHVSHSRGATGGSPRKHPRVHDGYASDAYENESADDDEFEMVRGVGSPPRTHRRGPSRKIEIKKIRVKVHSEDDARFIMIGPMVDFEEFEGKIREKFGFKSRLRLRTRDDGDMVTLGDQDDLDILISTAKSEAKRQHCEMGKMEVWVTEHW